VKWVISVTMKKKSNEISKVVVSEIEKNIKNLKLWN